MATNLSAKLDRTDSNTPWGFRLHGGKDFSSPLTIQRVTPGSLAAKCGLQVGDVIVTIGNTATENLRHKEAQSAVVSQGNSLDLTLKRGGLAPVAPSVDTYPQSNSSGGYPFSSPTQSYSSNYNVKPKPFGGSFGGVDEVTSATASLSVGSGKSDSGSSAPSSLHADDTDDFPPPPPPVPPPPASLDSPPSPAAPKHESASHAGARGGGIGTGSVTAGNGAKPQPTPTQSAVLEEETDPEQVPRYRGYTNPSVQSRTFKILQQQVDQGADVGPGLAASKAPASSTPPVRPLGAANDQGRVKAIMNRQYNTPSKLYSSANTQDTFSTQSSNIIENLQREEQQRQTEKAPVFDEKKTYIPSETFRMVQELDTGAEGEAKPAQSRTPFNPLAGKYGSGLRSEEGGEGYGPAVDPNSPLYRPTESASYKAATTEPQLKNPKPAAPFPTPPQPAFKPVAPAKRPEPTIVGSAMPGGTDPESDTIVVQQRSTITIPSRPSNTNTGSVFTPKGPKPFSAAPASAGDSSGSVGVSPTGGSSGGTWRPNVPSGDRKMRVGKLGEARNMPATGGAGRIPICHSCGTAIRGPFVLALDKSWCPDHFTCANPSCRRSLIDCGFVEEDGQLYCERDYEQYMAPRCAKCSGAIVGSRIEAMNQNYHPHCFLCHHCHQAIGGTSFHIENNEFYCAKDWAQLFQTKCYGCQYPIEPGDRWVEALGQNWHSECFNCSTCQVNLEGQPFYAKGGKPFCKKHATGGGRFG